MRKESYLAKEIDEEYKRKELYKKRRMRKEDFKDSNAFLNHMVDNFINDMKEEQ